MKQNEDLIKYFIKQHRNMWHWIAKKIKNARISNLCELKGSYILNFEKDRVIQEKVLSENLCYACLILTELNIAECKNCIFEWNLSNDKFIEATCISNYKFAQHIDFGLYRKCQDCYKQIQLLEASEIAEQIATLPLKEKYKHLEEIDNEE